MFASKGTNIYFIGFRVYRGFLYSKGCCGCACRRSAFFFLSSHGGFIGPHGADHRNADNTAFGRG